MAKNKEIYSTIDENGLTYYGGGRLYNQNGNLETGGNLIVAGTATISGLSTLESLTVTGAAALGSLTVGGGYGDTGVTISAAGAIQANGGLTIDGASTLTGAITGSGTYDPTISTTTAGGERGVNLNIAQATNALTGTLDAIYARATGYGTNSTTGRVQGAEIGARLPDADGTKAAGTIVGTYTWADAKIGACTTLRGFEASLDGGAGSTATLAVAFEAFNNSSGTQTTSVAFDVNEGLAAGRKAFTYDFRGQLGETIDNATDGTWTITGAAVATGSIASAATVASQTTENVIEALALTSDSTFLTGSDITYSGARGSSVLKLTGTYSGVDGGFSGLYSNVTTSGNHTAAGAGVIGIKGVVTNTGAITDGSIYAAQFIAKHNHATNDMANAAALIGLEAWAYDSDAGTVGTLIGANVGYHNECATAKPGGSVYRGLQIFCDDAVGASVADEATGLCIWNMAGTQTHGIKFVKSDGGWTTDITLQNGETISNATDGILDLTATTIRANGILDFSAIGADTQTGLIGGAGAAASTTAVTTAAAGKFLAFYTSTTATSGDSVLDYSRIYNSPASASSGTTIAKRAFVTTTTDYGGNAHGTVSTASLGADGSISGVMSGVKAVCDLGAGTNVSGQGSFYPLIIETQSGANSQAPTVFGYINVRSLKTGGGGAGTLPGVFAVLGDTGAEVDVGTATSNMVKSDLGDAATAAGLKVLINGTYYWIQLAAYSP